MKKIIKTMAVIAAIAMMFGMTACSDSDDDSSSSTSISYATLLAKASGEDQFAGNTYTYSGSSWSETYAFGTDGYVTETETDSDGTFGGIYRYVVDANNNKLYMQLYKEYDEETEKYYTYEECLSALSDADEEDLSELKEDFEEIDEYSYKLSEDGNTLTLTMIYKGEEETSYDYTKQ